MQAITRQDKTHVSLLQYQDEAYTLAYYLLSNEDQAAATLESVFSGLALRRGHSPNQLRLEIFQRVINTVQSPAAMAAGASRHNDLSGQLKMLNLDERTALVLVDVLGLEYAQAGWVLGIPQKILGKLVAAGRVGLSRQLALV
jgi:predicted DNA-binding protein (UPF0251 family)